MARALITREQMEFLDTMRTIARMLAVPGASMEIIVGQVQDLYAPRGSEKPLTRSKAMALIGKAQEYLASDAARGIEFDKSQYVLALEEYLGTLRKHLIKKVTKRIVESSPSLPVGKDADSKTKRARGEPELSVTLVRTEEVDEVFDPRIGQLYSQTLKELAEVSGARPKREGLPRSPGAPMTVNIANVIPGADGIKNMADGELLNTLLSGGAGARILAGDEAADTRRGAIPEGSGDDDEEGGPEPDEGGAGPAG